MKISKLAELEAQVAALRSRIEALRSDPELQREVAALDDLKHTMEGMGYTAPEAAELLYPERFIKGAKPVILNPLKGFPRRPERKLLLLEALREARIRLNSYISRLEADETCAKKLRLEEAVRKAGYTPKQAAEILLPSSSHDIILQNGDSQTDDHVQIDSRGRGGRRPQRTWVNPFTGEQVQGKSPTMRRLREWAEEHSVDLETVRSDWQKQGNKATSGAEWSPVSVEFMASEKPAPIWADEKSDKI